MINLKIKLKSHLGETMAEALVSVLIVSLASVMLATMISAAAKLNLEAADYDEALDNAITQMSSGAHTSEKTLTISVDETPLKNQPEVKVISFSENNISLSSYTLVEDD